MIPASMPSVTSLGSTRCATCKAATGLLTSAILQQPVLEGGVAKALLRTVQELLAMVPSPVVAVIMLFPVTDKSKAVTQEGVLVSCEPWAGVQHSSMKHLFGCQADSSLLLVQRMAS